MRKEQQRSWTMSIGGLVALIGCGLVVRGVGLAWRPGAWILAGVMVAVPALFAAYDAFRSK